MKKRTDEHFVKLHATGKKAEEIAEEFCNKNNILFKEGTDDDQDIGIDFYFSKDKENPIYTGVDVKKTFDIFLGNGKMDEKFFVRQPFRNNCKAQEYWILNPYTEKWYYQGPIIDYLVKNFFIDADKLQRAKNFLQKCEAENKKCEPGFLKEIKEKLESLVYNTVHVSCVLNNDNFWDVRLRTYELEKYEKDNYDRKFYYS